MEQELAPPLRFARLSAEADRLSEELRAEIERGGHGWRTPFVILYCELSILILAFVRVFIEQVQAGELDAGPSKAGPSKAGKLGAGKIGAKNEDVASGKAGPRGAASPDGASGSAGAGGDASGTASGAASGAAIREAGRTERAEPTAAGSAASIETDEERIERGAGGQCAEDSGGDGKDPKPCPAPAGAGARPAPLDGFSPRARSRRDAASTKMLARRRHRFARRFRFPIRAAAPAHWRV